MNEQLKDKLDDIWTDILYYLGYYYVQDKYYDFKHFIKNVILYRKELTHDICTYQSEGMLAFIKKFLQGVLEELKGDFMWSGQEENSKDVERCIYLIDQILHKHNFNSREKKEIEAYDKDKEELFNKLKNFDRWWV